MSTTTRKRHIIGVFGGNEEKLIEEFNLIKRAEAIGFAIASNHLIVLSGGTGPKDEGVKGAALRGANGSPWIGIDPKGPVGTRGQDAGIVISTDLGHKRNY